MSRQRRKTARIKRMKKWAKTKTTAKKLRATWRII